MKRVSICWVILLIIPMVTMGYAETPDVMTIVDKMDAARDAAFEMGQKVEVCIQSKGETVSKFVIGKAQKHLATGNNTLVVLLEPDEVKGFAYLYKEKNDNSLDYWIYPPAIKRIRRIIAAPWNASDSFLNTEFTYADMGFVGTKGEYKFLGEEEIGGTPVYKIEKNLTSPRWYYSRIVTWISKKTYLPLRRDFYDVAERLYKRQFFEDIFMVGKTPVPYKITMTNLQTNSRTVLSVKELKTGLAFTENIFTPERLYFSSSCPIWERVCYPFERTRKR